MADKDDGALFGEDDGDKTKGEEVDVGEEEAPPVANEEVVEVEKEDNKQGKEKETVVSESEDVEEPKPKEPEKPKAEPKPKKKKSFFSRSKKEVEKKAEIKPSPPPVAQKTPRPSINSNASMNTKLLMEKNEYSTHRKRSKWEAKPTVHPEDICYIPAKKMNKVQSLVNDFRCLQGTLPRPVIWCIGRYNTLTPEKRFRAMKFMSRGIATAVQFGDGVLLDGGIDWCAGDVKFPKEIRTAFPLIGVSNSQKDHTPPEGLHWGHDQHVIFNCHDDDFPKATLNVVDAITHVRKCKCVVVVIGGAEELDLPHVKAATELGYPIIVLEGTGGLADELVDIYKDGKSTNNWPRTALGKVAKRASIKVFAADGIEDEGELAALIHFFMLTNVFDYDEWDGRYGPPG